MRNAACLHGPRDAECLNVFSNEEDIMAELTMEKLISLCKSRGFIYAGSEIYGGLANTWDYGPLGVEFKNNIKKETIVYCIK